MPACLVVGAGGAYEPSGATPCPGVLALTPEEFARVNDSPFHLSASEGALLSVAITGVWAIAWVFRAAARAASIDGEATE